MIINGIYVDKRVQKSKTKTIKVVSPLMQTDKVVTATTISNSNCKKREKKSSIEKVQTTTTCDRNNYQATLLGKR